MIAGGGGCGEHNNKKGKKWDLLCQLGELRVRALLLPDWFNSSRQRVCSEKLFYCGGQHRSLVHHHTHTHTQITYWLASTHAHTFARGRTVSHTRTHACEVKGVFDLWCCYTDLCRILPLLSCGFECVCECVWPSVTGVCVLVQVSKNLQVKKIKVGDCNYCN